MALDYYYVVIDTENEGSESSTSFPESQRNKAIATFSRAVLELEKLETLSTTKVRLYKKVNLSEDELILEYKKQNLPDDLKKLTMSQIAALIRLDNLEILPGKYKQKTQEGKLITLSDYGKAMVGYITNKLLGD